MKIARNFCQKGTKTNLWSSDVTAKILFYCATTKNDNFDIFFSVEQHTKICWTFFKRFTIWHDAEKKLIQTGKVNVINVLREMILTCLDVLIKLKLDLLDLMCYTLHSWGKSFLEQLTHNINRIKLHIQSHAIFMNYFLRRFGREACWSFLCM